MKRVVMIGGLPVEVDDSNGNFIFPDDEKFSKYGWTSEKFDGYLTINNDLLWISDIRSKMEHQQNFVKLLIAMLIAGYRVFIPTPSDRMISICNKFGGFHNLDIDDVSGLVHEPAGKILTSYYANAVKIDKDKNYLVQISNSTPSSDLELYKFDDLIPSWDNIVKPFKDGLINEEVYNFKYWSQIKDKLPDIAAKLIMICARSGRNVVLMCYESPEKFCHRHLAAGWLSQLVGYEVAEYK